MDARIGRTETESHGAHVTGPYQRRTLKEILKAFSLFRC